MAQGFSSFAGIMNEPRMIKRGASPVKPHDVDPTNLVAETRNIQLVNRL